MGEPNSVIRKMLELREVIIYGSLLLKLEQSPMGVIVKKKGANQDSRACNMVGHKVKSPLSVIH